MQPPEVREQVLWMLYRFCMCLSNRSREAAMAVLLEGNVVELTMGNMADIRLHFGLDLFEYFFEDPGARARICVPAVADQLIKRGVSLPPQVWNMPFLQVSE